MDAHVNLFPSKLMTYLLLAGEFICTLLYCRHGFQARCEVACDGLSLLDIFCGVAAKATQLLFASLLLACSTHSRASGGCHPKILPVGSVWRLAPHPCCWLSASDRQHLLCLGHSPVGTILPRGYWGHAQEGPHWECPAPATGERKGEGAGRCRHCWFETGAPAVVPGTAFTFWDDGGSGITPLGTHGEICLNFSNREGKEENICARKEESVCVL